MSNDKTLYWVKFVEQGQGRTLDEYVLAKSISELDKTFADILEIKVIKDVMEL